MIEYDEYFLIFTHEEKELANVPVRVPKVCESETVGAVLLQVGAWLNDQLLETVLVSEDGVDFTVSIRLRDGQIALLEQGISVPGHWPAEVREATLNALAEYLDKEAVQVEIQENTDEFWKGVIDGDTQSD